MDAKTLHTLLEKATQYGASDILLKVGQPPAFRVNGVLHYLQGEPLRPEHTEALSRVVLRHAHFGGELGAFTEYDTSYGDEGTGRFRVNVYRQRGSFAMALRAIPKEVPQLDSLLLPKSTIHLSGLARGLILVVGAAGNGKTTTLAAMIRFINEHRRVHIITIEDPIEYLHVDRLSCVSQREIGIDTPSFPAALRAALRQDPDVILVGEIRDEETMEIALKAAETGHLVLATMHTPDVPRTISRVLALLGGRNERELRRRLADNLGGIVAQRLVPRADGKGRVVTAEVLVGTSTARDSICDPEHGVPLGQVMEEGQHPYGMQTFAMSIDALIERGILAPAQRAALQA